MSENNEAFGWDDVVEETAEFVLLPEGDATFEVTNFERARKPMGKLGTVNVAVLTMHVTSDENGKSTNVICNLPLHRLVQFKIFSFFTSIGQRKHGDGGFVPDWSCVNGATGRCMVSVREWTGKDGDKRKNNEITKFLEPVENEDNIDDGTLEF